jgi:hypothetical protein
MCLACVQVHLASSIVTGVAKWFLVFAFDCHCSCASQQLSHRLEHVLLQVLSIPHTASPLISSLTAYRTCTHELLASLVTEFAWCLISASSQEVCLLCSLDITRITALMSLGSGATQCILQHTSCWAAHIIRVSESAGTSPLYAYAATVCQSACYNGLHVRSGHCHYDGFPSFPLLHASQPQISVLSVISLVCHDGCDDADLFPLGIVASQLSYDPWLEEEEEEENPIHGWSSRQPSFCTHLLSGMMESLQSSMVMAERGCGL